MIDIGALRGQNPGTFATVAREIGRACETVGFFYMMNAADVWVEAPPIDGTFIVNIGDMLQAWTNGRFKATQHRVVNLGQERYSMPLFFAVDYHTLVEPLPQFVDAEHPIGYGSIVAGDHLAGFSINMCKHLRKRVLSGDLKIDFPIHRDNPFKRKAVNEV